MSLIKDTISGIRRMTARAVGDVEGSLIHQASRQLEGNVPTSRLWKRGPDNLPLEWEVPTSSLSIPSNFNYPSAKRANVIDMVRSNNAWTVPERPFLLGDKFAERRARANFIKDDSPQGIWNMPGPKEPFLLGDKFAERRARANFIKDGSPQNVWNMPGPVAAIDDGIRPPGPILDGGSSGGVTGGPRPILGGGSSGGIVSSSLYGGFAGGVSGAMWADEDSKGKGFALGAIGGTIGGSLLRSYGKNGAGFTTGAFNKVGIKLANGNWGGLGTRFEKHADNIQDALAGFHSVENRKMLYGTGAMLGGGAFGALFAGSGKNRSRGFNAHRGNKINR